MKVAETIIYGSCTLLLLYAQVLYHDRLFLQNVYMAIPVFSAIY